MRSLAPIGLIVMVAILPFFFFPAPTASEDYSVINPPNGPHTLVGSIESIDNTLGVLSVEESELNLLPIDSKVIVRLKMSKTPVAVGQTVKVHYDGIFLPKKESDPTKVLTILVEPSY